MKVMVSMKEFFFDRDAVRSKLTKKRHGALLNAGSLTRKVARNSLRRRKAPSQPGQPPHVHTRSSAVTLKNIQFSFDLNAEETIVGPVGLVDHITGDGAVPGILERGAMISHQNARRRKRKIGFSGEIAIDEKRGKLRDSAGRFLTQDKRKGTASTKEVVDYRGKKRRVTYTRLKTDAQVARADAINEELYGPETITGEIKARPFMEPAVEKAAPKFPEMYLKEGM